jgi:hypothetical protein
VVLSRVPLRLLLLGSLALPSTAGAIRPVSHYHDLVAGSTDAGFRNGSFTEARFSFPQGLAISPGGERLYVADRNNNRIRVVFLAEDNRVETLAGTGEARSRDGSLKDAALDHPYLLAALPAERLLVFEPSGKARLVDLQAGTVRTVPLARDVVGGAFALAVSPSGAVWASNPGRKQVFRIELASWKTRPLISNESGMAPTALCLCGPKGDRLVIADAARGLVVSLRPEGGQETIANATNVRALTCQGDRIWALCADNKAPLVVLAPAGDATPRSVWGPMLSQADSPQMPVLRSDSVEPAGLVLDPREDKRLLVASPYSNLVGSVRDYDFAASWDSEQPQPDGLTDFAYPRRKPPATIRLLLAGDSRSFYTTERDKSAWGKHNNRMQVLTKRLELFLNAEAALAGRRPSAQVLSLGRVSWDPLFLWPATDVPPLARSYDVDRVLLLVGPDAASQFTAWYERPLGKDGLPTRDLDGEFSLRSPRERIQPGRPLRFFRECEARGLVKVLPDKLAFQDVPVLAADPVLRSQLVELLGEPVAALSRRLADGKGKRTELTIVYLPKGTGVPGDAPHDLWKAVAKKYALSFLDLSDEMAAFRISFSPLSELVNYDHFSAEGNTFVGWLLARRLESAGYLSPVSAGRREGDAAPPAPVR